MFRELSSSRLVIDGTMQYITYSEIESWSRLTGIKLSPKDINAIKVIDQAFINKLTALRIRQQQQEK